MAVNETELKLKLQQYFPDSNIIIKDLIGDNDHYSLEICSKIFKGKNRVEQHRLVNEALKDCLGTALHALTIKISVPD